MSTGSRGGASKPPINIFDARAAKAAKTAKAPTNIFDARAAKAVPYTKPDTTVRTKPNYKGEQPVGTALFGREKLYKTTPTKAPNVSDLIFGNEAKAIGPDVLKKAANPRVADLSAILGAATGIPSTLDAIRHHNVVKAGVGIASFLPVGRAGKALEDAVDLGRTIKAGRSAEETQQHLLQAAKNAVAEGHGPAGGGGVKNAPKLKPGEVTPETGGELGAKVRSALKGTKEGVPGAAEMRAAQNEMRAPVRGERAAAAKLAEQQAGGGLAGHAAAREAMRGEFPKIHWNNELVDLNQDTLNQMVHFVQNHPGMKVYDQNNTIDAIQKLTQGETVTASEEKLLYRAFGKETGGQMMSLAKNGGWRKAAVDIANVPRAIMAAVDLSAPGRQGLIAGVTHPVMAAKNLGPMIKMAKNEDFYQVSMNAIHSDPLYPLMHKGGLALTDIGKSTGTAADLGMREEARMSNYAEHMPGNNPISKFYNGTFGRVVRGSDRAYVGFLNKLRADYFNRLVTQAAKQGHDVNDAKTLKEIAGFVNMATGRGNVPQAMQDHLATMNALFFSPRLLASRIEFLASPLLYSRANPVVRREALRAYISMGAMAVSVLELAKLAGAKVVTDPTNADFAKVKLGNTRVDFLGGNQQLIRLAAQLYTKRITSSTTGKTETIGNGFGKTTRLDVITKFLQGKASPIPSLIVDAIKGQDFTGKPVQWNDLSSWQREAASHLIPFLAQDLKTLYDTSGPNGLLAGPLDLFGVGVQAYKPKPPKTGGNPFDQSGSNPFNGGGNSFDQPTKNPFDK